MTEQKRKKRIATFHVSFVLPAGLSLSAAQAYVRDAVETWRGSYYPGSRELAYEDRAPEFDIDHKSVRVKRIYVTRD